MQRRPIFQRFTITGWRRRAWKRRQGKNEKEDSCCSCFDYRSGSRRMVFFQKQWERPPVRTERVTRGDLRATTTATGTVSAVTTVLVAPRFRERSKRSSWISILRSRKGNCLPRSIRSCPRRGSLRPGPICNPPKPVWKKPRQLSRMPIGRSIGIAPFGTELYCPQRSGYIRNEPAVGGGAIECL